MTEAATATIPTGTLMKGKKGLIMGVANDKSLAWGITQYLHAQGIVKGRERRDSLRLCRP